MRCKELVKFFHVRIRYDLEGDNINESVAKFHKSVHTSSNGFNALNFELDALPTCWTFSMLDRIRAAMTPRWSREMVFAALLSVWLVDLTSSREETFKGTRIRCLL
jgi:hypothetical protein